MKITLPDNLDFHQLIYNIQYNKHVGTNIDI